MDSALILKEFAAIVRTSSMAVSEMANHPKEPDSTLLKGCFNELTGTMERLGSSLDNGKLPHTGSQT